MGVPPGTDGAESAYRNLPQLLALAKHPNVAVKATGQPGYVRDPYPFPSIHDALHRVFDAFGPRRMFWGTDITRMRCSWRQCVTLFTEELPWLKGADLDEQAQRARLPRGKPPPLMTPGDGSGLLRLDRLGYRRATGLAGTQQAAMTEPRVWNVTDRTGPRRSAPSTR